MSWNYLTATTCRKGDSQAMGEAGEECMTHFEILRRITAGFHGRPSELRLMYCLFVVSLAVNVFLVSGGTARRGRPPAPPEPLPIGSRLPLSMQVTTLDRQAVTLSFSTQRKGTLVYVFSPKCIWCEKNKNNIRALANFIRPDYDILGISTIDEGLRQHLDAEPLPFPVYLDPSHALLDAFRMVGTPATYLVSADGLLKRSWRGAYRGLAGQDIQQLFGVRLPDTLQ
jgi:peroxiredoxin